MKLKLDGKDVEVGFLSFIKLLLVAYFSIVISVFLLILILGFLLEVVL